MSDDPARSLAEELDRRGLAVPGRLLADAHRPLSPLLEDVGAAIGPLARVIVGDRGGSFARWLERPGMLDEVIAALDERGERRAGPG